MGKVNVRVDAEGGSVTVQKGRRRSQVEQTETVEQDAAHGTTVRRRVRRRVTKQQPDQTRVNVNAPADTAESDESTNVNISGA